MNKNKMYWSVMGIEPNPDEKVFSEKKLKSNLIDLIKIYEFNNVVTAIRQIKEEYPEICKLNINLFMK